MEKEQQEDLGKLRRAKKWTKQFFRLDEKEVGKLCVSAGKTPNIG